MRIVFLSRYQSNTQRGAENFVKELAIRLSKNHQVDILSGKSADSLFKVLKGDYDVVVPINGRMQSLKVSLGRLFKNYKILISGHSGVGRDDIWNIVIARPNAFIALTDYMAKWAKQWAMGVKVLKISDGVDIEKFKPEGEKVDAELEHPVILSVGALSWYKHHDKAIEAVARLGKGSLLIVGQGEEKTNLEKLGKEKLGNRFKIAHFPYEEMPKAYRGCDLFTLPSWNREAFGIVYLEALASGLGVVAPDDASRKEVVGDAGILVNVNDLKAYTEALSKALSIDWKQKARAQAEKFSWDKIAKQYEEIMTELSDKRK